jgi:hypothetical protein
MAGCRIVNQSVADAVAKLETLSGSYKTAGEEFVSAIKTAIADMEGATKDAILQLVDTQINDYVAVQLPSFIKGMSDLLEGNRSNFESVDQQIASSISGG